MQKVTRVMAMLLVLVAVVLAVLAIALGRHTTGPARQAADAGATSAGAGAAEQSVAVAVAATVLQPGVPIAADQLRLAHWPQRPVGAAGDTAALAGSIPLVRIPTGTPVLTSLLAKGVAMALQPGERAMAVPVDEQTGAGNRIQPGDYVDVFLSLKTAPTTGFGKSAVDATQTRLLLSRLRVLAYGGDNLPARPPVGDTGKVADEKSKKASSSDAQPPVPHTAVLAVPIQDADRLLLGVQNGKLSLALRRPDDTGHPDHTLFPQPRTVLTARSNLDPEQKQLLEQPENRAYAGINGQGLAGHAPTPPPRAARRAPAWRPVEVIRGTSDADVRVNRSNSP